MAQPLSSAGYDPDDEPIPAERLQALEGGNEGGDDSHYGKPSLYNPEGDGPRGSRGGLSVVPGLNNAEHEAGFGSGVAAHNSAKGLGLAGRLGTTLLGGKKRRRAAGIGGTIGIAVIVFFAMSLSSGVFELEHLGHILGRADGNNQKIAHMRTLRLLRAAQTGEIGETRLGYLRSTFHQTVTQLADVGIEFNTNEFSQIKSATIDTDKLSKNFPELKDMNDAERKAFISHKFDIPPDKVTKISSLKGKYAINTRDYGVKATKALVKKGADVGLLDDGKVITALKTRSMAQFYDLPSLFHPLKRITADETKKLATRNERKAAEEERQRSLAEHESAKAAGARSTLQDDMGKFGLKQGAAYALLLSAGMCLIRESADAVITVNHYDIVAPSIIGSQDAKSTSAQLESNIDTSSSPVAQRGESLTDKDGQTVFQGRAMQALAGQKQVGPDLPVEYQQAFSPQTTAANIKSTLGGGKFGAIACSPEGLVVQAVGGFALLVSGFIDGGASWGAKAGYIAGETAKTAATAGSFQLFKHFFVKLLGSDAIMPKVLSGPLGGNLLAMGSMAGAGQIARSGGGVALSAAESLAIQQDQAAESRREFQSKPLFARLFDRSDYRSGIAHVEDNFNPNPAAKIQNVALLFTHIGSAIPTLLSTLMPRASAAPTVYVWPAPQYGIPASILNNAKFANPYDNAAKVAVALDGPSGGDYISRAKDCFGVAIAKDDGGLWGVVPQEPTNPSSEEYVNAHCDDLSDENWQRILLFVQDTGDAEAYDCYSGIGDTTAKSCTDIGVSSPDGANAATAVTQNTLASGDAKSLAQQILPYIESGQVYCGSLAGGSESADCSDIQNTAKGTPIGGNCAVKALTPNLLALILGLVKDDHWKLGISAICSDHHPEGDGAFAGHSYGSVADFSVENGASGAGAASNQKFVDDVAALLKKSGGSFGQVGNCHPIYDSQKASNFTTFSDACNHQHVRAAP